MATKSSGGRQGGELFREPRQAPAPIVRLIVRDGQDQVPMLKRAAHPDSPGWWRLPGGKVDYAETMAQAARRELL